MKEYKRLTTKCEVGIGLTETSGNIVNDYEKVINRLAALEDKIENGTLIEKPKYKLNQKVYTLMCGNAIRGTIDGYDVYKKKYLVFIENEHDFGRLGFGNEWFSECELFSTKAEAEKKLKE